MAFNKDVFLVKEELLAKMRKKAPKNHTHSELEQEIAECKSTTEEVVGARKGNSDLNTRLNNIESNISDVESNLGVKYTQITKLGVVASEDNPHIISIPLESSKDLCRPPIEVLKFEGYPDTDEYKNVIETVCDFDNADKTSFEEDEEDLVLFDGKMHLKTSESFPLTNEGTLGEGNLYSLDLTEIKESLRSGRYKQIESISFE